MFGLLSFILLKIGFVSKTGIQQLNKFGTEAVMMDTTHHCCDSDHVLLTVVVQNENSTGHLVAACYLPTESEAHIAPFLEELQRVHIAK